MNLTDRQFWLDYWENKEGLIFEVKEGYILSKILKEIVKKNNIKTGIELGGFPGYYAIYLKKYLNIDSTLFDYIIHPGIVEKLINKNSLKSNDINLIEADLFNYETHKKYDLVLSVGLIEHFEDTKNIISKHLNFLNNDGVLFINIPNFRGFNGLIQKIFDPEIYKKHYIPCMDIPYLLKICQELDLKNINIKYYGGFMIWLENYKSKSIFFKLIFKTVWFIFKVFFKIIPIETKLFSPYINIVANK